MKAAKIILLLIVIIFVIFTLLSYLSFAREIDLTFCDSHESYQLPIVLGIGLPRTGTCSLSSALNILGWRSHHCPLNIVDKKDYYLSKRNAFCDLTMLGLTPSQLNEMFPNAKMIYTYRKDEKAWVKSMINLRKTLQKYSPMTKKILKGYDKVFGKTNDDILKAKLKYEKELDLIQSEKLLKIDLTKMNDNEKWTKLSKFLNVSVPLDIAFPYESHVTHHLKQIWGGLLGWR